MASQRRQNRNPSDRGRAELLTICNLRISEVDLAVITVHAGDNEGDHEPSAAAVIILMPALDPA